MVNLHTVGTQVRKGSVELQYVDIMVEDNGQLSGKQRLEYHPTIDMTLNTTTSPITVTPPAGYDGIASLDIHFTNSLKPEKLYKTRFGSSTLVWSSVDMFDCKMNKGDKFRIWNSDMTSSIVVEYAGKGAHYINGEGQTVACLGDSYLNFTWGGYVLTPTGGKLGIPVETVNIIENS